MEESLRKLVWATCPYCQTTTKYYVDITTLFGQNWKTVHCDNEMGGCEKPFAISVELEFHTSVYAFKGYEGE